METTNDRIKSWIGAHLMSGVQFAKMINMPYDTYKVKISGKSEWKISEVFDILDATGCEFTELFVHPKK